MTDNKFRSEYQTALESIKLPADFTEKLISKLNSTPTSDTGGNNTSEKIVSINSKPAERKPNDRKNFRIFTSLIAASLVILVGLTLTLALSGIMGGKDLVNIKVSNARNLMNISGARVTLISPAGSPATDRDGNIIETVTDEEGVATLTLPDDEEYTAEVTAEGFIPYTTSIDENENVYISPVMDENTYRAVLTWNEGYDLDSHMSASDGTTTEKIYYFDGNIENQSGEVLAALDVDNSYGDGPETITFNIRDDRVYRYSVACYSSLKYDDNTLLSKAKPKLTLYKGEECIGVYNLESDTDGNVWCVLEIQNHNITVCDRIYSVSAITEIQ